MKSICKNCERFKFCEHDTHELIFCEWFKKETYDKEKEKNEHMTLKQARAYQRRTGHRSCISCDKFMTNDDWCEDMIDFRGLCSEHQLNEKKIFTYKIPTLNIYSHNSYQSLSDGLMTIFKFVTTESDLLCEFLIKQKDYKWINGYLTFTWENEIPKLKQFLIKKGEKEMDKSVNCKNCMGGSCGFKGINRVALGIDQCFVPKKEMNRDNEDYVENCEMEFNCEYADKNCSGIECPEPKKQKQIINGYEVLKPITIDSLYKDNMCPEAKLMLSGYSFDLFVDITKLGHVPALMKRMESNHPEFFTWLEEKGYIKKVEEKTYTKGDKIKITGCVYVITCIRIVDKSYWLLVSEKGTTWTSPKEYEMNDLVFEITKSELNKIINNVVASSWKHIEE